MMMMMMIRLFRIGCQTTNTIDTVVNIRCHAHAESHIMVFRPVWLVKISVYCTTAVKGGVKTDEFRVWELLAQF
jgi:hypothetical protein